MDADMSPYARSGPHPALSNDLLEAHVVTLHKVLYAADEGLFNISDALDFVHLHCEDDMRYENPISAVHGKSSFMKQLSFIFNLPGQSASELEDIHKHHERFGTVSFIFSHTCTWSLLDLDASGRSSGYTTATSTTTGAQLLSNGMDSPPSPQIRQRLTSALRASQRKSGLVSSLMESLKPSTLIRNCTSLSVRVQTHVVFNEQGKVVLIEDSVSIKDLLESIPVFGHVYNVQRRALAAGIDLVVDSVSSLVSRANACDQRLTTATDLDREANPLGLQLCTDTETENT